MNNIAVIIPFYVPDDKTEALFQRCKKSVDEPKDIAYFDRILKGE